MHILYASERPPYPYFLGGAARAAHILLLHLSNLPQVTCSAVGALDYSVSPWHVPDSGDHEALGIQSLDSAHHAIDCGYPILLIADFHHALAGEIERKRPDVVWSQLEGALPVLQTADRLGVAGLCYVHDAEFDHDELRQIAALNCHLIASSKFLANKVYQTTGRHAQVIYPPTELYFDTTGDPGGVVTMINPHPVKGLDTIIEVVRRLPDVGFLLQESWKLNHYEEASLKSRLAALPNVSFEHRVSDMRSVYRKTRLLIAPSRWEEGFGLVALEAQSCGIPVIASRRGGLPEAVGDGGLLIDDFSDVNAWVKAIDSVLSNPERYRALAERARCHAASDTFAPDTLARSLYTIVQSRPERPGRLAQSAFAARRHARNWPFVGRLIRRLAG